MSHTPWYNTWRGAIKHTFWSDRRILMVTCGGVLAQVLIKLWQAVT